MITNGRVKKVELNGEQLDIEIDVVLPGQVHDIEVNFSWYEIDEFEGKSVCVKCKFFNESDPSYVLKCYDFKKQIDFIYGKVSFIHGEYKELNKNGTCPNYIPFNFEDRLDFLLDRGRKRLEYDVCEIFTKLEYFKPMINIERAVCDAINKALKCYI